MSEQQRIVAVISPWEKLSVIVKHDFRVESLPEEKKVMVWRDDLQTAQAMTDELKKLGIPSPEIRTKKVTAKWQDVH
jgi:hypothetical protein